jgi:outer membrane protein OmpA-like peptidoglycan-associated protein
MGFCGSWGKEINDGRGFCAACGLQHKNRRRTAEKQEDCRLRNLFRLLSDQIKKESEPVLREIGAAMKNNPDWKLTVDDHTDSIGGDAYNLDLSKRRAAAVKPALVDRFQIGGDRLVTDGFGMRRPVDRNDTIEGGARNRRVELSRE